MTGLVPMSGAIQTSDRNVMLLRLLDLTARSLLFYVGAVGLAAASDEKHEALCALRLMRAEAYVDATGVTRPGNYYGLFSLSNCRVELEVNGAVIDLGRFVVNPASVQIDVRRQDGSNKEWKPLAEPLAHSILGNRLTMHVYDRRAVQVWTRLFISTEPLSFNHEYRVRFYTMEKKPKLIAVSDAFRLDAK